MPITFQPLFPHDDAIWTPLRKHVVKVCIMGKGFGCDDYILLQLDNKVERCELHRYLHRETRLATFSGL